MSIFPLVRHTTVASSEKYAQENWKKVKSQFNGTIIYVSRKDAYKYGCILSKEVEGIHINGSRSKLTDASIEKVVKAACDKIFQQNYFQKRYSLLAKEVKGKPDHPCAMIYNEAAKQLKRAYQAFDEACLATGLYASWEAKPQR